MLWIALPSRIGASMVKPVVVEIVGSKGAPYNNLYYLRNILLFPYDWHIPSYPPDDVPIKWVNSREVL